MKHSANTPSSGAGAPPESRRTDGKWEHRAEQKSFQKMLNDFRDVQKPNRKQTQRGSSEQTRSLEPGYCVAVFGGPSLHNQSKLMATLYFVCHPYYTVTLKRQMKFRRYELLYSGPIYPLLFQFHSPNTLHAGRPYCLHSHRWSPLPHFPLSLSFSRPSLFHRHLWCLQTLSTSYSHGEHKPAAQINPCGLTVLISKYSPFLPERSLAQQWPQWEKANPQLSIKSFAGLQS